MLLGGLKIKSKITPITLFIIIAILPIGLMFRSSLIVDGNLSLKHYIDVFSNTRQFGLLIRSLGLAFGAMSLSLLFGVPFAFILARADVPGSRIFKWLYLLPLCIPSYVHAIAWIYLSSKIPFINLYGVIGSATILSFSYFPFVVLLTLSGLYAVDQRLEDAAKLNHSPFEVLQKVTLPLVSPYIMSGAVFVFIFALFNYSLPALLRVQTYPVEIFAQFSAFYNEGGATAQSFPIIVVALILLYIQRYVMGSRSYVTMDTGSKRITADKIPNTLSGYRKFASSFMFLVIFVSVIIPLSVLVVQSQSWASYEIAFRTSSDVVITTLSLSLLAATLILCLGYSLSGLIENKKFKAGRFLDLITFIPFAFPATVLGIGLIYFWNTKFTEAVYTTSLIVIIAYIARFIPFTIRALNSNLKQISPSLKEAAMLSDKAWWRRFIKIDLPLSIQGITAGWIIAFILCMSELGATLLVVPPGKGTIALKIYTLMHYGANQIVAALSLILIGLNLLVASAVIWGAKRKWNYGEAV